MFCRHIGSSSKHYSRCLQHLGEVFILCRSLICSGSEPFRPDEQLLSTEGAIFLTTSRSHRTIGYELKRLPYGQAWWWQPLKAPHMLAHGKMHVSLFFTATYTRHKDSVSPRGSSCDLECRMALYRCHVPPSLPCADSEMKSTQILEKMGIAGDFKGYILANTLAETVDYHLVCWYHKGRLTIVL